MASILLENVPAIIHEELKARAEAHHTSIERETLACLQASLHSSQTQKPIRISNDSLWEARHSAETR